MKTFKILLLMSGLLPLTAFAGWTLVPGDTTAQASEPAVTVPLAPSTAVTAPPKSVPASATKPGFKPLPGPAPTFVAPFENTKFPILLKPKGNPAEPFQIMLFPGSLKMNMERIMKDQPWTMLWNMPYDYEVVGRASVRGKDLYDTLNKILKDYPVKATFYESNHIMTVTSTKRTNA